jgi:beta-lactam-binding protein with PASTA domain
MGKFFRFLKSKTFLVNVILAVLVFVVLIWAVRFSLDVYTHHGEKISVPNLAAMPLDEAVLALKDSELGYEVIDSAAYNSLYPPLAVIEQFPLANADVKSGRVIKLTINPAQPRKIELPNIVEKTTRRAIHYLESRGLKSGELIYVPDIARDRVLGLRIGEEEVEPGTMLEPGTVVDLIVGKGLSNEKVRVPYLKFLTLEKAQTELSLASLNLGILFYDEDVVDSASAVIYKHFPSATLTPRLKLGSDVDLWLTNDSTKIVNDSLNFQLVPDSLGLPTNEVDTNHEAY